MLDIPFPDDFEQEPDGEDEEIPPLCACLECLCPESVEAKGLLCEPCRKNVHPGAAI